MSWTSVNPTRTMVEATQITSVEQAWLAHYLNNIIQYAGILGVAVAVGTLFRAYWRDRGKDAEERRAEREQIAVWRSRVDERMKVGVLAFAALLLVVMFLSRRAD